MGAGKVMGDDVQCTWYAITKYFFYMDYRKNINHTLTKCRMSEKNNNIEKQHKCLWKDSSVLRGLKQIFQRINQFHTI